ncbi:MAG: hypothetical protein IKR89_09660 [Bacteroidaceae bacterium]|nr:hypothetical protein [Bacteroidaceae bacterium]
MKRIISTLKAVAHCDRWGTLSDCLLFVLIPQVVPTTYVTKRRRFQRL